MSMYTVSTVVFLFGVMLLCVGLIMIMLGLGAARERRILERTEVVPLGSWRERRRLAADGVTDFGAAGQVTAPVSNAVCAWYEAELRRTPPRGHHNEDVDVDRVWRDHTAHLPVLRDGTGAIVIGEELLSRAPNQDDPVVTVTTTRKVDETDPLLTLDFLADAHRDLRLFESLELVETRLDAGVAVFAVGQAVSHQGQLRFAAAPGRLTILTTDNAATVIERRRTSAAGSRSMARGFLGTGVIVAAIGLLGVVVFVPAG
jgi:exonuclease VII small subunit